MGNKARRCAPRRHKPHRSRSLKKRGRSWSRCKRRHVRKCRLPELYQEKVFLRVPVTDQLLPLPAQDTSRAAVYSYAVINTGQHPVRVKLEITPNGTDYALDVEGIVAPGETEVIVPSKFLKYTRVAVCTTEPGQTAVLSVYYQAQLVR